MKQFINIYRSKSGHLYPGGIFDSRELAVKYKSDYADYVQTVEFEVKENEVAK